MDNPQGPVDNSAGMSTTPPTSYLAPTIPVEVMAKRPAHHTNMILIALCLLLGVVGGILISRKASTGTTNNVAKSWTKNQVANNQFTPIPGLESCGLTSDTADTVQNSTFLKSVKTIGVVTGTLAKITSVGVGSATVDVTMGKNALSFNFIDAKTVANKTNKNSLVYVNNKLGKLADLKTGQEVSLSFECQPKIANLPGTPYFHINSVSIK